MVQESNGKNVFRMIRDPLVTQEESKARGASMLQRLVIGRNELFDRRDTIAVERLCQIGLVPEASIISGSA